MLNECRPMSWVMTSIISEMHNNAFLIILHVSCVWDVGYMPLYSLMENMTKSYFLIFLASYIHHLGGSRTKSRLACDPIQYKFKEKPSKI